MYGRFSCFPFLIYCFMSEWLLFSNIALCVYVYICVCVYIYVCVCILSFYICMCKFLACSYKHLSCLFFCCCCLLNASLHFWQNITGLPCVFLSSTRITIISRFGNDNARHQELDVRCSHWSWASLHLGSLSWHQDNPVSKHMSIDKYLLTQPWNTLMLHKSSYSSSHAVLYALLHCNFLLQWQEASL